MLQQLNWMRINEIENKITDVLLRSGAYGEFVCHFVKSFALSTNLSVQKQIWLLKTEIEFLKMKLSERKWNWMPENEITCIFFEIDTGMLTSNQFRCKIERPFTNLNDISTKLAGKTYIKIIAPSIIPISIDLRVKCPFYKKWNKKKMPFFLFLVKFSHCIWGVNSYILPNFQVREQ